MCNTVMSASPRQYHRVSIPKPSKRAKASPKASKRASINNTSQLVFIPGRESVGKGLWYTERELAALKARHMRSIVIARVLLSKPSLGDHASFPRAEILGIERHLSDEIAVQYKRRKRDLLQAVDLEQNYQRAFNIKCPERLARASRTQSRDAMRLARLRALSLEHDVATSR